MADYADYSRQMSERYAALLPEAYRPSFAYRGPRYAIRELERVRDTLRRDRNRAIQDKILNTLDVQNQVLLATCAPFGSPRLVRELVQDGANLVLTAQGGAGKTTAFYDLAARPLDGETAAALIDLADFATMRIGLPEYLAQDAEQALGLTLPAEFFQEALAGGHLVVCLDGLDQLSADERVKAIVQIETWAKRFGRAQFIVAARPGGDEPALDDRLFAQYALQPWSDGVAAGLEQAWNEALDGWVVEGREAKKPFYAERHRLWRYLAYALRENGCAMASNEQAGDWLADVCEYDSALKLNRRKARSEAKALIERSASQLEMVAQTDDGLRFSSRLMQDILVARALEAFYVESGLDYVWIKVWPHLWDAAWQESILLAFRFLSQDQPGLWGDLLTRLLDMGAKDAAEPVLHRHLALAARAIAASDLTQAVDQGIQKRVVDGLIDWLNDPRAAGRLNVVDVLYELGGVPYAVERVLQLAGDTALDGWERQAVCWLLGRLGRARRSDAVQALRVFIENGEEVELVRLAAATSLGQLFAGTPVDDSLRVETQETVLTWVREQAVSVGVRGVLVEALGQLLVRDRPADLLEAFVAWAGSDKEEKVSYTVKIAAARALSALAGVAQGEAFGAQLNERLWSLALDESKDVNVRIELAETLGKMERAADAAQVLLAIGQADGLAYVDQKEAFDALRRVGYATPEIVEAVKKTALATDRKIKDFVRLAAAYALSNLGERALSIQSVLQLVADKSIFRTTRHEAFAIVAEMGLSGVEALDEAAVAILRVWAKEDNTTEDIRERAIESLSALGVTEEAFVRDLVAVLQNKREYRRVRSKAAWALGELPQEWAEPVSEGLQAVLYDPEEKSDVLRVSVARALLHFTQEQPAVDYLKAVTEEAYMAQARHDAAMVLIEYGMVADAVEPLLTMVQTPEIADRLRQSAVRALGRCAVGNDQVMHGLVPVFEQPELEPNVRQEAYIAFKSVVSTTPALSAQPAD